MQLETKWRFPASTGPKRKGSNDGNITHFTGKRDTAFFRELLQNSLDAHNGHGTVKVEIYHDGVPADFIKPGLFEALRAGVNSEFNDDKGREMFEAGLRMLQCESVPTLFIRDSNTTGCPDILKDGEKVSLWYALAFTDGFSKKTDDTALGTFGIGKTAPFCVTPLRAVFYSTCYDIGNGKTVCRKIHFSVPREH